MGIAVIRRGLTEYRMQCMHDHARIAEPVKTLALTDRGRELESRLSSSRGRMVKKQSRMWAGKKDRRQRKV